MNAVLKKKLHPQWTKDFIVHDDNAIRRFASLIGDTNPVHHNDTAAQKRNLKGIIAPGVMVIGFVSAAIADEIPDVYVCRLDVKFKYPLYAPAVVTVHCTLRHQRKAFARVNVIVKNYSTILAEGSCLLALPEEYK